MSFFRDCADSIRGNARNFLTTPITKKKLIICGAVFTAVLLLIVIIVVVANRGSSPTATNGSDALKKGPVAVGFSNTWLKSTYVYRINDKKNLDEIEKKLNLSSFVSSNVAAMIWPVGASSCSDSAQKDAVSQTLEGIDAAQRLVDSISELTLASETQDVTNAKSKGEVSLWLSLDGGYTIDSRLAVLRMFYGLGARIFTLTGKCGTPWAGDSASKGNLSTFGQTIIGEANRMGLLLDLAGSSQNVITATLNSTAAPVIFNGVGSSSLTDVPSNLNNETLKSLTKGGHVVMVSFKCSVIKSKDNCTVGDVIGHLNVVRNLTGASGVGLAMDFGYDGSTYPSGLTDVTHLASLFDELYKVHHWSLADLERLAYKNVMNALKTAATAFTKSPPADGLEQYNELTAGVNLTCYSDVSIRYPQSPPVPVTTTAPMTTAPMTTAPMTTAPTTTAPTAATTKTP